MATRIDPNNLTLQLYQSKDENLISTFDIDTSLTFSEYIEFFLYDNNKVLINSSYNYTFYNVKNDGQSPGNNNEISTFSITPENDVTRFGSDQGEFITYYNFLSKKIGDNYTKLFIQEISSDRTEVRLDSNILSPLDILEQTNNLIQEREQSNYFLDFYLNFGENDLVIANNIKLDNEDTDDPTVVVKLYEPLPSNFDLKDELWVVTTFNEPEAFRVSFPSEPINFIDYTNLAGPNFNLPVKDEINNSTQNLSYTDLMSGAPTSSLNQLNKI